jgi:transcriptional regulator with XRE-family HTH domain
VFLLKTYEFVSLPSRSLQWISSTIVDGCVRVNTIVYDVKESRQSGERVTSELGQQLKTVRQVKGLSLRHVARPAEISPAYLQKLEAGEVGQPSPKVLSRLGKVLDIPYETLMVLAGYEVVASGNNAAPFGARLGAASFSRAVDTTDLTEQERAAVAAFISHLRDQRKKGS